MSTKKVTFIPPKVVDALQPFLDQQDVSLTIVSLRAIQHFLIEGPVADPEQSIEYIRSITYLIDDLDDILAALQQAGPKSSTL